MQMIQEEWISADGKVMRGTLKSGEKQAIIHAVSHESRIDVAQARQAGDKSSEITVMREFLKETGLENAKISLDAHHCNPETMTQVEQADGLEGCTSRRWLDAGVVLDEQRMRHDADRGGGALQGGRGVAAGGPHLIDHRGVL